MFGAEAMLTHRSERWRHTHFTSRPNNGSDTGKGLVGKGYSSCSNKTGGGGFRQAPTFKKSPRR
jgi:hypothetical protein